MCAMIDRKSTCCPRCDYDMRGLVGSWSDACPLEGTCSECGLSFHWRDVLHPAYGIAPWCVETKRSLRALPAQVIGTLLRTARPRRFWSSIALHHAIRWPRLAALVVSLMLATLILLDLATAAIGVADHRDVLTRGATSPVADLEVFVGFVTRPLSVRGVAGYVYRRASGGTFAVNGLSPRDYVLGLWGVHWPVIAGSLLTPLTTAIAFAALPIASRRARVRPRHLVRVGTYGVVVPVGGLALAVAGPTWSALLHPPIVETHGLHLAAALLLIVGTFTWWHAAIDRYLRMERAMAVALSVTVIGLLLPLAAVGVGWYLLGRG
jgi:hypothetical protein